jgi:plastocyanin
MKKFLPLALILVMIYQFGFSTKYTIGNVGTAFSPSTLTIHVGDTVVFTLSSAHNAMEVSEANYTSGTATSNGGFSVPNGGGTVIFHNAGTYYFVCVPHAAIGMKGIITVTATAGIENLSFDSPVVQVYPNPASYCIKVSYSLDSKTVVNIRLVDVTGKTVEDFVSETREPGVQADTYSLSQSVKPGLYFVDVRYGNHSYVKKVVVQ